MGGNARHNVGRIYRGVSGDTRKELEAASIQIPHRNSVNRIAPTYIYQGNANCTNSHQRYGQRSKPEFDEADFRE